VAHRRGRRGEGGRSVGRDGVGEAVAALEGRKRGGARSVGGDEEREAAEPPWTPPPVPLGCRSMRRRSWRI
jgi:hypothetical protein